MGSRGAHIVLLTSLVMSAVRGSEPLATRVDAVTRSDGYGVGHWGILVVDAKTGETIFERNPDEMFCPASVTKLFSTAAALTELGGDYRFHTPVVRHGKLEEDGTLRGDLILVAQGDLALGGRTGSDGTLLYVDDDHTYSGGNLRGGVVRADPLAGLVHLAREVAAAGIKRVSGDVIVDDRLFEHAASTGSGPSKLTPILINDNLVDVVATPAEVAGEPASVRLIPASSYMTVDIQVETVGADESPSLVVHDVGPRRFQVRGKIPMGHAPIAKVYEVDDPASFARTLFIEALRKRGVHVHASSIADNPASSLPTRKEVAELPKVAEYASPPLMEYLKVILKVSHNLHASTLPLLLAAHQGERTLEQGLRREGVLLKGLGVNLSAVSFGGGAGGSRSDLVSPRATVTLLRALAKRPDFLAYESALPILGRDGTLARAVGKDSPARGHVRAKTGTYWVDNSLTGNVTLTSKALAGYMETSTGRALVITFFVNEVPLDASGSKVSEATVKAGQLLGRLCEVFYDMDASEDAKSKPKADATGR
jgi:serine-type D-Ala-D-Ala carboxypeptidase/endopeptidase (penicillin-binding protein 4)